MRTISLLIALTSLTLSNAFAADGKTVYATCAACHQAEGQGIPGAFPPLTESEWVNGPVENLIRIQLRGLSGPIKVKGVEYNSVMAPLANQSDEEIAAVLTYIRSHFGNNSGPVSADEVKALRSEVGKPMLTVADLIDPSTVTEETPDTTETSADTESPETSVDAPKDSKKVGSMEHTSSITTGLVIGFLAWAGLCIVPAITGLGRGR
ncbi:Cytochrome c553 [Rubritalea squalenifaciens DSM 18772]|uniref:Cytochrome c553 n=1 Tax=Rubritalea squalenifaciens DSM 18772 TaxID=1123071 RepID=A0A1M6HM15_9BACT|nr:cytochrome c [Rubritalea squalenifaciens]SHJ23190.1 Cytochrome c553 [Rubritalea squalenifaciens DSM 18772]